MKILFGLAFLLLIPCIAGAVHTCDSERDCADAIACVIENARAGGGGNQQIAQAIKNYLATGTLCRDKRNVIEQYVNNILQNAVSPQQSYDNCHYHLTTVTTINQGLFRYKLVTISAATKEKICQTPEARRHAVCLQHDWDAEAGFTWGQIDASSRNKICDYFKGGSVSNVSTASPTTQRTTPQPRVHNVVMAQYVAPANRTPLYNCIETLNLNGLENTTSRMSDVCKHVNNYVVGQCSDQFRENLSYYRIQCQTSCGGSGPANYADCTITKNNDPVIGVKRLRFKDACSDFDKPFGGMYSHTDVCEHVYGSPFSITGFGQKCLVHLNGLGPFNHNGMPWNISHVTKEDICHQATVEQILMRCQMTEWIPNNISANMNVGNEICNSLIAALNAT